MRNWKTTLAGVLGAVLNLVANGTNWKAASVSVGLAAIGALAKDHNVTGGTVQQ